MPESTYLLNPLIPSIVASIVGAVLLGFIGLRTNKSPISLFVVGAISGAIGANLFTAPLNYCMFQADQSNDDVIVGWILVALGATLLIWIVSVVAQRYVKGLPLFPRGEYVAGAFQGRHALLNALLVLSPTLLILIFFVYIPFFDTFRLSTFLARFGTSRTAFICVDNFSRLLSDEAYHMNLYLSFVFSAFIILFTMSTALLIAVMANQPIKGAKIYRTLLIWPYAVSPIVAGSIFQLMLSQESGVINQFITTFGFEKVSWLTTVTPARFSVIVASVWNIIGFNILFYIAGLQNVPKDVLEAASIDGANAWQRFWRITFPLLSPFTFFLVVTNTVYAFFDTFGLIFVLTRGGPTESTFTAMYRIYVQGILGNDIGKSNRRCQKRHKLCSSPP
ncbi:MAG: sugar ABC transporter permease, partial [Chloroflexota bacterium]